jgi:hypothetical protein
VQFYGDVRRVSIAGSVRVCLQYSTVQYGTVQYTTCSFITPARWYSELRRDSYRYRFNQLWAMQVDARLEFHKTL